MAIVTLPYFVSTSPTLPNCLRDRPQAISSGLGKGRRVPSSGRIRGMRGYSITGNTQSLHLCIGSSNLPTSTSSYAYGQVCRAYFFLSFHFLFILITFLFAKARGALEFSLIWMGLVCFLGKPPRTERIPSLAKSNQFNWFGSVWLGSIWLSRQYHRIWYNLIQSNLPTFPCRRSYGPGNCRPKTWGMAIGPRAAFS